MKSIVQLSCLLFATFAHASADTYHKEPEPPKNIREFGIVPLIGGDSDIGIAVGTIASWAAFDEGAHPYLWRAELNALTSFKKMEGWQNPFQDYYAKVTIPSLADNSLRLVIRVAYTKYGNLKYYGLGNASPKPVNTPLKNNQFQLSYPHGTLELQYRIAGPLHIRLTADYNYDRVVVYPNSKLANDLATMPDQVIGAGEYGVAMGSAGIVWDSRDNETSTQNGMYHNLSVRFSPGGSTLTPYRFAGVIGALRGYVSVWDKYLILAGRLVGDVLVGDVPFFLLAESAEGYALGGVTGVRGVPSQRYYGKTKAYGTFEVRVQFPSYRAYGQNVTWGTTGFVDAGCVIAGYKPDDKLDGKVLGLKYGVGGGIRLQWGETFLLRGDAAWSPDANPVAFYFNVGHAF